MLQDQQTGAAANDFGRATAPNIARAMGALMTRPGSNEAILNGKKIVIKCAARRTTSVGVSLHMLPTLDAVVGAFQRDDGGFDLYSLDAKLYAKHLIPTRSKGPSAGKVGIVKRSVFLAEGNRVGVVKARAGNFELVGP